MHDTEILFNLIDKLSTALYLEDCNHGVKYIDERRLAAFKERYPHTFKVIENLIEYKRANESFIL